jgi:tetratricopeptide (TPR) repeat protein
MLDEAAAEFDKEIAISPREPWSYENRGTLWLDKGDSDRALPLFREALSLGC